RFAASLENVKMVLSGMSNLSQMEENLATMEAFTPITERENELLFAVAKIILETPSVSCTACGYCMDGCPQNIPIPAFLKYLNNRNKFGWSIHTRTFYNTAAAEGNPASACIGCGQCESICPQHIEIIKHLKEAAEVFES
ncbi:MAG: 4Fe-4S dicluster domain-containing protein, partial [Clostridia bacterium]|nr:4Fe-4S dicluster domain-containing protein [Clostridia bacterium]